MGTFLRLRKRKKGCQGSPFFQAVRSASYRLGGGGFEVVVVWGSTALGGAGGGVAARGGAETVGAVLWGGGAARKTDRLKSRIGSAPIAALDALGGAGFCLGVRSLSGNALPFPSFCSSVNTVRGSRPRRGGAGAVTVTSPTWGGVAWRGGGKNPSAAPVFGLCPERGGAP
jgi:hypothetical protein